MKPGSLDPIRKNQPFQNFGRGHRPLALTLRLGDLDGTGPASNREAGQHLPGEALPRGLT